MVAPTIGSGGTTTVSGTLVAPTIGSGGTTTVSGTLVAPTIGSGGTISVNGTLSQNRLSTTNYSTLTVPTSLKQIGYTISFLETTNKTIPNTAFALFLFQLTAGIWFVNYMVKIDSSGTTVPYTVYFGLNTSIISPITSTLIGGVSVPMTSSNTPTNNAMASISGMVVVTENTTYYANAICNVSGRTTNVAVNGGYAIRMA